MVKIPRKARKSLEKLRDVMPVYDALANYAVLSSLNETEVNKVNEYTLSLLPKEEKEKVVAYARKIQSPWRRVARTVWSGAKMLPAVALLYVGMSAVNFLGTEEGAHVRNLVVRGSNVAEAMLDDKLYMTMTTTYMKAKGLVNDEFRVEYDSMVWSRDWLVAHEEAASIRLRRVYNPLAYLEKIKERELPPSIDYK